MQLLAEALRLCGLNAFTSIALGSVGVLRSLLEACRASGEWKGAGAELRYRWSTPWSSTA